MKILVINGGFRQCNTWKIVDEIKEYLNSYNEKIVFEYLQLKDINLPYCTGCSTCFIKGHIYCPHYPIMNEVIDKINNSDGLIFAGPTYNRQMPALTKNFFDHLCFALHRPRFFNKKALVITTTGGVGGRKAVKWVSGTLCGIGFNKCYELALSTASYNNYKINERHNEIIHKKAKAFFDDISSGKLHSPQFGVLIPFNLFRGMSFEYQEGKEYENRDGYYWKETGLINKVYFEGVPIPFYKKIFGSFFFWIARVLSKRIIVTYRK